MHKNLGQSFEFNGFNETEILQFATVSSTHIVVLAMIRFVPISIPSVCTDEDILNYIVSCTGFIVNSAVMYTLNIVLLYLSLRIIKTYDNLITKIQNDNGLNITDIKREFDKIMKNVRLLKQKWEFAVSVSLLYTLFYMTLSGSIWMFNISDELHEHCDNSDVWTSFILVLTRDCARIFGLSYGILRLNHKPKKLAKTMNEYCDWDDLNQQFKIQRIIKMLTEFQDKFKILGVGIGWHHFYGVVISAITASIVALFKKRVE